MKRTDVMKIDKEEIIVAEERDNGPGPKEYILDEGCIAYKKLDRWVKAAAGTGQSNMRIVKAAVVSTDMDFVADGRMYYLRLGGGIEGDGHWGGYLMELEWLRLALDMCGWDTEIANVSDMGGGFFTLLLETWRRPGGHDGRPE